MTLLFFKYIFLFFHPFFVSMTELEYKASAKEMEVSVRLFTDDIENTLKMQHPESTVDILHPKDPQLINKWLNEYIRRRLQIKVNGTVRPMQFVGYEEQSESIWVYYEIKNMPLPKQVHVFNSLLYDYKKEQINMVRYQNGTLEKSSKIQFPDNTIDFNF